MPNSVRLYGLQPTRLHSPWDSPGKNTGMGCCAPLQRILPTQGSNLHLLHLPALAGEFFITSTTWKAHKRYSKNLKPYHTMKSSDRYMKVYYTVLSRLPGSLPCCPQKACKALYTLLTHVRCHQSQNPVQILDEMSISLLGGGNLNHWHCEQGIQLMITTTRGLSSLA